MDILQKSVQDALDLIDLSESSNWIDVTIPTPDAIALRDAYQGNLAFNFGCEHPLTTDGLKAMGNLNLLHQIASDNIGLTEHVAEAFTSLKQFIEQAMALQVSYTRLERITGNEG